MNRLAGAPTNPVTVMLALCLALLLAAGVPDRGNAAGGNAGSASSPAGVAAFDSSGSSESTPGDASADPLAGFVLDTTNANASAAGAPGHRGSESQPDPPRTFRFFNRVVVEFRAPQVGDSPLGRAEAANARLESLLRRGIDHPVGAQANAGGVLITLGGRGVFAILTEDVDTLAGETLEEVRDAAVRNLSLALTERRESRSASTLLRGVAYAVASLLLLLLLLWLTRKAAQLVARRLTRLADRLSGKAVVRDLRIATPEQLVLAARSLARALAVAVDLLLLIWWVPFALRQFPFTRPWGEAMRGYLLSLLRNVLLTGLGFVPELLVVVLIVTAARFLVRLTTAFFTAAERGAIAVPEVLRETAQPTRHLCALMVWAFAIIMAYPYLPGSGSEAFKGVSIMVGVMASLGSAGLVGQLVSGFVIMYSRALRPGDFVRVGDYEGVVLSVGMLSTKLQTLKREEINIPNNQLVSTTTKNYSRLAGAEGAILYTTVTIGYGTPWRQVHAMLCEAAARTAGLRAEPPPFVLQTALSDFYVEYQLNAHLENPQQRLPILAALHTNIQDVFNEHGVQIMSPHYESDPAEKVWVPRERWYAAPASSPDQAAGSRTSEGPRPKRHEPQ